MSEAVLTEVKNEIVKEKFAALHHKFGHQVRLLLLEASKDKNFNVSDFSEKANVKAYVIWSLLESDIANISIAQMILVSTALGHDVEINMMDLQRRESNEEFNNKPHNAVVLKVLEMMDLLQVSFKDLAKKLNVSPEEAKSKVYNLPSDKVINTDLFDILFALDMEKYLDLKTKRDKLNLEKEITELANRFHNNLINSDEGQLIISKEELFRWPDIKTLVFKNLTQRGVTIEETLDSTILKLK